MAKDYKKGAKYRLYFRSGGTYGSPTWAWIKAAVEVSCDCNFDDVVVPESGSDTGHLKGEKDPTFTFTLYEDAGDTNVETLIAAIYDQDTMVHLAVSRGDIATSQTKWVDMECLLRAPLGANRADASSYDVTAYRHANSDNNLRRNTTA